ncbi:MAG: CTP synthase [Chloroflexi bacterium]|jgi:CTP synthase|nr:CTP synthase [Chloroflexota bacterium]
MTRYVFVTGGVVSSVGKGIATASIGRILKSRGISVTLQKLDPYLNVDPGTMSPYQHGEVFVTEDGAETDLDLGHYERFTDENLTQASNVTSGQIYSGVIGKERRGDFLGGTIQVVPHVTDRMKQEILKVAEVSKAEVVISEIGGTVGDIEAQSFLEAIRQMRVDLGTNNVMYIHVTLLPYISASEEVKTKPTQHSVKELRSIGIQPDVIICRSDYPVPDGHRDKIALFCNVEKKAVIPLITVSNIYEVPLILDEAGLGDYIVDRLDLQAGEPNLDEWRTMVERIKTPKESISIALVGKYVQLKDSYISVREALRHAALAHDRDVDIRWIDSEELEKDGAESVLDEVQGIIIPGGFGHRGIEGMIKAAKYARINRVPYLGLCLGMHVLVIEYARHVLDSCEPNSTEFATDTCYPVIDLLPEQRSVEEKGGTMRLGRYPCRMIGGTKSAVAYDGDEVFERHRHRFEFNNDFREALEKGGLVIGGVSPDGRLVEIAEVRDHPWMVGTQAHPEFLSRPNRPHPLFCGFVGASKEILRDGDQHTPPI